MLTPALLFNIFFIGLSNLFSCVVFSSVMFSPPFFYIEGYSSFWCFCMPSVFQFGKLKATINFLEVLGDARTINLC
jgi:hypothetical protein